MVNAFIQDAMREPLRIRYALFLLCALVLPVLAGVTSPNMVQHARMTATAVVQPVFQLQTSITLWAQKQIHYILEWPNLKKENEILKQEVASLERKLIEYPRLTQENKRLGTLLDLKNRLSGHPVPAVVIGRDPSSWSHYIVIDRGKKDGIRVNTPLIHPDGLVGKVVLAGRYSSRAILLTDRESRVSALDVETRDVGLIEGTGTMALKMTFLDPQAKVQVGDMIVSSGLGGIYPKGVPIGRVFAVGEEKGHLMLFAMVKPSVSFSKLEELLCIKSRMD